MKFPAVFLSHGAPTVAVEQGPDTRAWAQLGKDLGRPEAILMVSAHWDTSMPTVSSAKQPETIHDFNGFPRELYEQRYPAPGAPELAEKVAKRLGESGFPTAIDPNRGLDHGAWVPLKWMYPAADIPVTQLSVQSRRGPRHHYELGKALQPFRDDGVLVLASGGVVHNLRDLDWQAQGREPAAWARDFNDWIANRVDSGAVDELIGYRTLAPSAQRSHPTEDHFDPFFVALGAGGPNAERMDLGFDLGTLSMDGYVFRD
jgi:4,5-DOPA dioxygenase extradiol